MHHIAAAAPISFVFTASRIAALNLSAIIATLGSAMSDRLRLKGRGPHRDISPEAVLNRSAAMCSWSGMVARGDKVERTE